MLDVMLDLETMGNGPRAAIVAIGAVEFDPDTGTVGERFYQAVDLATSVSMGGEMDASTVLWWMQQGDEARAAFSDGGAPLASALLDFSTWMHERGTRDEVRVWGNGAAFDNVILASAYKASMQVQPWRHWNDRCYRTIKALHPGVKMERTGVHHNAADDAESQARHLVAMIKVPMNRDPRPDQTVAPYTHDDLSLLVEAAGMVSYLNHGAASHVSSEGCHGVTQEHLERFAALLSAADLERCKVFAVWAHNVLGVLSTLDGEDMEDGGEHLRLLRDRGEKLVQAVLHG